MKHTRTWRRLAAVTVALAATVAVAPSAVADEPAPEPTRAIATLEPGAPAEAPGTAAPEEPTVQAAAAVTAKPEDTWDFFRGLNTTRIGAGIEPAIRNGNLASLADTWARQQAANGTTLTDPTLVDKIPGSWSQGYQAIYTVYGTNPLDAATYLAEDYAADWVDAGLTDLGIAMYEGPGYSAYNRYTLYVIGVGYTHSTPRAGEMTLYRFYRPATGTHFYSTSAGERNSVIGNAAFRYEGQVAYVLQPSVTTAGTSALNRFYQPSTGTHFYTSSKPEYDRVRTFPQYSLDGVAGKVYTTAGTGRVPMHRFYRPASGTHFYTANAGEVETVKNLPGYTYEGVAFYLRTAS